MALLMSKRSAEEDRANADSDTSLKFLGGLVANDVSKRPSYADDLMTALPRGCVLQYALPKAPDNLSQWPVYHDGDMKVLPGVWCLQIGAPGAATLGQCISAFLNHGILNKGGWSQVPEMQVIQRTATPASGACWTDYMKITLKPRGAVTNEGTGMLDEIVSKFPFLQHDGAKAFTAKGGTNIKYGCASEHAAVEALLERDRSMYMKTFPGTYAFGVVPSNESKVIGTKSVTASLSSNEAREADVKQSVIAAGSKTDTHRVNEKKAVDVQKEVSDQCVQAQSVPKAAVLLRQAITDPIEEATAETQEALTHMRKRLASGEKNIEVYTRLSLSLIHI